MGKRIRELREARGLTQEQLAHEVGVTVKAVYMWEHGTRMPQLRIAARVADILNTTIDALAGRGQAETEEPVKQTRKRKGEK